LFFNIAPPVAHISEALLYDLRGHGRSECSSTGYTLGDMVQDLADILRLVGWWDMRVHFVGNSYGGLIGLSFAIKYPKKVASLVLLDSELTYPEWADHMRDKLLLGGDEQKRKITDDFWNWAGRHKRPEETKLADSARRLVFETSLLSDLASAPVYSDEELSSVDLPVLAYYGEKSDARQHGERLAKIMPRCELRLITGASHFILWDAPVRLQREIPAWIIQQTAGMNFK
jgi:pimeloyl-ACP methyl ester carboxylesterase